MAAGALCGVSHRLPRGRTVEERPLPRPPPALEFGDRRPSRRPPPHRSALRPGAPDGTGRSRLHRREGAGGRLSLLLNHPGASWGGRARLAVGPAAPRTPTTARVMHVYCPWWGPTRPVGGGEEKRRSGHEATPPP